MGRKPCCEKVGLKRGPWTAEEDQKLVLYISSSGLGCWRAIPKLAGLLRCGKSCRLRWTNYLRPDLKRGIFTEEEEDTILGLHATLGNRWSRIAAQLPGRTDNEIKNYWNTRLKKRLRSQGLDPATHLPLGEGEAESEGDDGEGSDASGSSRKAKKAKGEATKPAVRQPRGPKPAPQLKMCQSDDGPVLVKVPKSSPSVISPPLTRSDDELSSCSTVTAEESHTRKLTRLPSYPAAELWESIKPTPLLDEWADSYQPAVDPPLLINPYPKLFDPKPLDTSDMMHFNAQDDIFQGTWSMETCPPAPESLFAPSPIPTSSYIPRETIPPPSSPLHQAQELQRLAAILDLL